MKTKKYSPSTSNDVEKRNKYKISYYDNNGNLRQRYENAANERDALVTSWLNNSHVVEPVSVERIA